MSPAERLKNARHSLDFSVEEMAGALHLRGANAGDDVRNWERGRREPSGVVVRCAEALVVIADLIQALEGDTKTGPAIAQATAFLGVDP